MLVEQQTYLESIYKTKISPQQPSFHLHKQSRGPGNRSSDLVPHCQPLSIDRLFVTDAQHLQD